MTVQRLINLAFFDLGAVQSGETPNSDESTDGLDVLNHLVSTWSIEELTVPVRRHYLMAGQANTFTIGVGGNWVTIGRVLKVEGAVATSGNFRKPMAVVGFKKFSELSGDDVSRTQVLAELLGVDNSYPLVNARLFPQPSGGGFVELHTMEPMAKFAALTDAIDLPDGYEAALRKALAIELYPQYGRQGGIDPALAQNAQNAKAAIAQLNASILLPPEPPQQQAQ